MAKSFQMEPQEHPDWCWAAVCQSIECYFSGSLPKQCEIADTVLGKKNCCTEPLDTAAHLEVGLKRLGALQETMPGVALSFNEIYTQIVRNSLPVCVRIGWHGQNRGHFVVIWGCPVTASGEQWLQVADPFYGYSIMRYEEFVHSYLHAGEWTDTFLVKKPVKKD
jgi:Papain-like cysteine protease AvrRpt2